MWALRGLGGELCEITPPKRHPKKERQTENGTQHPGPQIPWDAEHPRAARRGEKLRICVICPQTNVSSGRWGGETHRALLREQGTNKKKRKRKKKIGWAAGQQHRGTCPEQGSVAERGPCSLPEMWGAVAAPCLLPAAWLLALHAGRGAASLLSFSPPFFCCLFVCFNPNGAGVEEAGGSH